MRLSSKKVRQGYLDLVQNEPDRVKLIDGSDTIPEIADRVFEKLIAVFPFLNRPAHVTQ